MSEQELEVTETELDGSTDSTTDAAAVAGEESEVESAAPDSSTIPLKPTLMPTLAMKIPTPRRMKQTLKKLTHWLPRPPRLTLIRLRSSRASCAARRVTGTSSTPTQATKTA